MKVFTKEDLVNEIKLLDDIESKAAAKRIIETVIETLNNKLAEGCKLHIGGFVNFEPITRNTPAGSIGNKSYPASSKKTIKVKPTAALLKLLNA